MKKHTNNQQIQPSVKNNVVDKLFRLEKRISVGYSEDNWEHVWQEMSEVMKYLTPQSRKVLSETWSTFYVNPDLDWLKQQFKMVKQIL